MGQGSKSIKPRTIAFPLFVIHLRTRGNCHEHGSRRGERFPGSYNQVEVGCKHRPQPRPAYRGQSHHRQHEQCGGERISLAMEFIAAGACTCSNRHQVSSWPQHFCLLCQSSMDRLKKQKNIVHSHNHDMHNGVRIGEAKRPGPQNQKRKKGLTRIWEEEGTSDSENSDPPDLLSSESDNDPRSKPGKKCKTTCTNAGYANLSITDNTACFCSNLPLGAPDKNGNCGQNRAFTGL